MKCLAWTLGDGPSRARGRPARWLTSALRTSAASSLRASDKLAWPVAARSQTVTLGRSNACCGRANAFGLVVDIAGSSPIGVPATRELDQAARRTGVWTHGVPSFDSSETLPALEALGS